MPETIAPNDPYNLSKFSEVPILGLEDHRDEISSRYPFSLRFSDQDVWPHHRFLIGFEFSNPGQRWLWKVYDISEERMALPLQPVVLRQHYIYDERIHFRFVSPSTTPEKIDHHNLGRTVECRVYPAPESPAYPFDLDAEEA